MILHRRSGLHAAVRHLRQYFVHDGRRCFAETPGELIQVIGYPINLVKQLVSSRCDDILNGYRLVVIRNSLRIVAMQGPWAPAPASRASAADRAMSHRDPSKAVAPSVSGPAPPQARTLNRASLKPAVFCASAPWRSGNPKSIAAPSAPSARPKPDGPPKRVAPTSSPGLPSSSARSCSPRPSGQPLSLDALVPRSRSPRDGDQQGKLVLQFYVR